MAALADRLTQFMDRPIVDATELKGNYQVALDLPIEAMMGMGFAQKLAGLAGLGSFGVPGASAPDTWVTAIIQTVKAVGFELQSRRAPLETIIVDDSLFYNPLRNHGLDGRYAARLSRDHCPVR